MLYVATINKVEKMPGELGQTGRRSDFGEL